MSTLERLFYLSRAAPTVGETEVRMILGAAEMNNRRKDVTGTLGYTGRHFAQVLEGDAGVLDALVQAIEADPRHSGVRRMYRMPVTRRQYGRWSMAYVDSLDLHDEVEGILAGPALSHAEALALHARLFPPGF